MAGTTLARQEHVLGPPESATRDLVIQLNALIADIELVRAGFAAMLVKLDADGGVTGTDYVSLETVAAADLLAAKIGDAAGTAISA